MNYKTSILALALPALMFSGCGQAIAPTTQTSTAFQPVSGITEEGKDFLPGEGPQRKTLHTAISYDGLTFVPTGETVAYQAHQPDVIAMNESIYLYYSGWLVGNQINDIAVAVSDDGGETWTHHNLSYTDLPEISDPIAPDLMVLEDGTIRMYFTANSWTQTGVFYAESEDGINFVYKGVVGLDEERPITNSTTHIVDDVWYQYVVGEDNEEIFLFEGSQEILEFTSITSFPPNGNAHRPLNGYWLDGKYHMLVLDDDTGVIRSMRTKNGTDWYTVDGERMASPEDGTIITDATVIELEETYLMFYSVYHPEEG